ncbi:MAG: FAD-dependent oxidoreductase, partial [Negativicutes bacterium]|nr:FAD-dependent oxidoreductase [Negativicutes bacterium]
MDGRTGYIFSSVDISRTERVYYDVVVVGTGIAGMAAALSLDPKLKAAVISKFPPDESSTYKAQGGIAIALGADDSVEQHIEDTLRVGRELCDKEAVELMVQNGIRA